MATRLYLKDTLYDRAFFGGTYNQGVSMSTLFNGYYSSAQDRHVMVGRNDADIPGSPGTVRYSKTGTDNDFTQATIGASTPFEATAYVDVRYIDSLSLWLICDDIGKIYSSPDGVQWTLRYTDPGARFLERIFFAENTIVCIGDQNGNPFPGLVLYSTDGITWTEATQTTVSNLLGVGYSPSADLWVAVGSAGDTWTTSNPTGTWTLTTVGSTTRYQVLWDATLALWVTVGVGGLIETSTNGTTWTPRTSGTTANLFTVVKLANGTFLIGGQAGTILKSTDLINWTQVSPTPTPTPDSVNPFYSIWQGSDTNTFYVVGDVGFCYKSSDNGATWSVVGSYLSTTNVTASTATVFDATASQLKLMNDAIGTGQVTTLLTSAPLSTQQSLFLELFASYPLATAQTVGGGSMILNTAQSGSSNAAQFQVTSMNIYVWRPSTGTKVGVVRDAAGTVLGGAAGDSNETVQHVTGITTSAINANAGDIIVCEVWGTFTQGMATSYNVNFYFNGTTVNTTQGATVTNHASFIELAETLTFSTTPVSLGGVKKRSFLQFFP